MSTAAVDEIRASVERLQATHDEKVRQLAQIEARLAPARAEIAGLARDIADLTKTLARIEARTSNTRALPAPRTPQSGPAGTSGPASNGGASRGPREPALADRIETLLYQHPSGLAVSVIAQELGVGAQDVSTRCTDSRMSHRFAKVGRGFYRLTETRRLELDEAKEPVEVVNAEPVPA